MKVSEMIHRLSLYQQELGDVEVLITDGYSAACYHGDYDITPCFVDNSMTIDIGIGGCLE